MFEKFTEKAIRVIMLAQEEARRLGHGYVGTEQILLGLMSEDSGVGVKLLKSLGVQLRTARIEVENLIGRGSGRIPLEIPFTPLAKSLLELSFIESRRQRLNYIAPDHLFLALLAGDRDQNPGLTVLENLGIDLAKLKAQCIEVFARHEGAGRESSQLPKHIEESNKRTSLNAALKRAVTDFSHHRIQASRDEQIDLEVWLLEVEHKFVDQIRQTEPGWRISEPDELAVSIHNAIEGIREAKDVAHREQQVDIEAWLSNSEAELREKLKDLAVDTSGSSSRKRVRLILLAKEEARRLGHNFIGTEQLLLGLIDEEVGIAAQVLKSVGVTRKNVRIEVEKIIGRGSGFVAVEIPFTPRVKRVLELSRDEARELGDVDIETQHVLLALIREGEGVAIRVLENLAVDLELVRKRIHEHLDKGKADLP